MRWRSIRVRLALVAAVSILAAVAAFALLTALLVSRELRGSLDSALRARAQQVAELAVSAPAVLSAPGALESPVSGRQIVVEVIDARGRILARSLTLGARLLPEDRVAAAARRNGRAGYEDIALDSRPFRLYAAPVAQAGGPAAGGAVLVASDTSDISRTTRRLALGLALVGGAIALLAGLAATLLSGRALAPLRRLAGAAQEIERTGDPARRLPAPATGDELAQLSGVLNRMLSSLQQSREAERRFLADASHELRTPVTSLLGNVEHGLRHGADPDLLAELHADATRLARLVDDLLILERAGVRAEIELVALDELVQDVLEHHPERARLVCALEPVAVQGRSQELRRAVENLLENALVHGPEHGQVRVGVALRDARAELTVSDEGPGPPAPERIFERFWRGPEATGRPGSGLGLAIVQAIVQRHGGEVSVEGASFTVRLPAATGAEPPSAPPAPGTA